MIKVVKFGGSSLADAVQIKKAGKIVLSEESRRYVVPSAPGKRFSDDTKVTDMLYRCYGAAVKEKKFTELLADIQKRYQEIIEGLGITLSLDEEFATIRDNFAKKIGRDYAASRGEYLNGRVIAAYLGYEFIDAAEVIKFDENGNFLSEETNQVLTDRLSKVERAVNPDDIELESDLALIAVVGRGMRQTRGTAGRIFSALAHAHVNVKMIDQGSSELNIIIGVREHDFEAAIKAIYDIFVNTQL